MITIKLAEMIEITSGQTAHLDSQFALNTTISDIVIDSRQIKANSVFVALKGEQFDGHDFIAQAQRQGAIACITEHAIDLDLPMIIVQDSRQALAQIAHWLRQKSNAQFVALTGSSGKTSVKEMTASILKLKGKTLYTQGNFNNEIGVPLTLFRLTPEDEFAVIELGANHQGEIAWTTQIVEPKVALINNIASAHLEGFGSLEGVAKAKGEIFLGLPDNGIGLINLNSFSPDWQVQYFNQSHKQLLTFSIDDTKADYFAQSIQCHQNRATQNADQICTHFQLVTPKGEIAIQLPLLGLHNVSNAIASAALAQLVGASLTEIQQGLAQLKPVSGRLFPIPLTNQITVIDDTYNANVGSMKAAIDVLAQLEGLSIFVVGDMGELGDQAEILHQEVGQYAKQKQIDCVLSVGKLSQRISQECMKGQHFVAQEALVAALLDMLKIQQQAQLEQKITVLVKGSRSSKMEEVVKALQVGF